MGHDPIREMSHDQIRELSHDPIREIVRYREAVMPQSPGLPQPWVGTWKQINPEGVASIAANFGSDQRAIDEFAAGTQFDAAPINSTSPKSDATPLGLKYKPPFSQG